MNRSTDEALRLAIAVAWRRRFLLIVPFLILPPCAFIAALLAPAQYEARMALLVQDPAKISPHLKDYVIGGSSGQSDLKDSLTALATLAKSDVVAARALQDLGELPPGLDLRTRENRIEAVAKNLSTAIIGNDIIEFRLRAQDAYSPAKVLQAITKRFIERLLSPERASVADSERFLENQIKDRLQGVEKAERDLADFKLANSEKLPALYTSSIQRLGDLEQKLQQRELELTAASAVFEDVRGRLVMTDPTLGRLEDALGTARSELRGLRARYTDEHSDVQAAERRLQILELERKELLQAAARPLDTFSVDDMWNQIAGLSSTASADPGKAGPAPLLLGQLVRFQEAQSKRLALQKEVDQLKQLDAELRRDIAEFGPIDQQLQSLERGVKIARENYDELAKRYEMARVSGALALFEAPDRIQILQQPSDPAPRVPPKYLLFVLAGTVAAMALGAGFVATAELLDPRMRRGADFARVVDAPVIVRIPRIDRHARAA
jgi:protein tyrosine kinase modulator